jgi:hypothetical protein
MAIDCNFPPGTPVGGCDCLPNIFGLESRKSLGIKIFFYCQTVSEMRYTKYAYERTVMCFFSRDRSLTYLILSPMAPGLRACLKMWRLASLPAVEGGILPPGKKLLGERSELTEVWSVATPIRRAGSHGSTSAKMADATLFRQALRGGVASRILGGGRPWVVPYPLLMLGVERSRQTSGSLRVEICRRLNRLRPILWHFTPVKLKNGK